MAGVDSGAGDAPFAAACGASWRPIVTGHARDGALNAVASLEARIAATAHADREDASLSGGASGVAVFHAQLARATGSDEQRARADACLDDAIEVLSTAPLGASLYAGFAGIAWATQLVGDLLHREDDDRNEAIDDALCELLERIDPDRASYDLIHGLTGLGVYALERAPRPAAELCVSQIVHHLARRAREDDHGTYWWTGPSLLLGPNRRQYPDGGVDLGVAHGIAGVLPFLAGAAAMGTPSADALLDGAVRWLSAHALDTGAGPTIPYFIADRSEPRPARSAWCYGDPGVAAAMLVAAREAERQEWIEFATRLAISAAQRPAEASGVVEAGFCHGSAGLAHLFNRLHQLTGEPRLKAAALFWLERTLEWCERAEDEDAPGAGATDGAPWNGEGLLEGAAGVALVLLAAGTAVEPVWDRMFAVSRLGPGNEVVDARA
jgi:lantibiotic biosynthesis protein